MTIKRFSTLVLSIILLISVFAPSVLADDKTIRQVYLHAQGERPTETVNVSTVYMGDTTHLYFAVDNPNKGRFENGEHKEPQYDMNGYTVKIYFNSEFFEFVLPKTAPIDYTVPDMMHSSGTGEGNNMDNLPDNIGYYEYSHGSDSVLLNGHLYNSAYLTVFFSGDYLPQKDSNDLWYNLCVLPLTPLKTGSTDVFIDTSGYDAHTLEIFAKNFEDDINSQTFEYSTINGGYHHIVIKDKLKPPAPVPNPIAGSYTQKQNVTLTAEDDCDIFYSLDNGQSYNKFTSPIEIEVTTEIMCYAQRISDGRISDIVTYKYEILPEPPYLFDGSKTTLIPNIYSENNVFTVYASDKNTYGDIDDGNEIYYTFSNLDVSHIADGTDPETEWVKLIKGVQSIDITKKTTIRLVTSKMGELSDIAWYYLSIKPAVVTSSHPSGEYDEKIDITLSCTTQDAEIYYTLDGSDPISNGILYQDPITLATDKTIRAVAKKDDAYSEISSFYYLFTFYDDYGIDAFYPSGVYEGNVQVTLTPNNPENTIIYSTDGGQTWNNYEKVLPIDKNTEILAKAVDKNGVKGSEYKFTYVIKPLPPVFAPESTQFTNADYIVLYCIESTNDTKEDFELFYTLDGSDPTTSSTRIHAGEADAVRIEINGYTVVSAVVLKNNSTYSNVVTHSYDIVTVKPVKPLTTLLPGNYTRKIGDTVGFSTQFMPVPQGTEIYYSISTDGNFIADPIPGSVGTIKYDGNPIEVKGKTLIKAIAVNIFGVKSDVGIFEYIVTPEAPKAAPSATVGGTKLPVVPVSTVVGSVVEYTINDFSNTFPATSENFYIDTSTGNAYLDSACTILLGSGNSGTLNSPAVLDIKCTLDNVTSNPNRYIYTLSNNPMVLAPPYADKDTGEYEEIKVDDQNYLLYIHLNSLNSGDTIEYKCDNNDWTDYNGNPIKIKKDTVLQIRSKKDGVYSTIVSYVYNFVPIAPIITLPSGRYSKTPVPYTMIEYSPNAPTDKDYTIYYRANGEAIDVPYRGLKREITKTMSFKAYVLNNESGRISKNTIHYYIIEADNLATGSVYIANPYDAERISAHILNVGAYADGIKLLTSNKDAKIHYRYDYTKTDGTSFSTNNLIYDNATPIMVNSSMDKITIFAWLEDNNGKILNSDYTHTIDFIHLNVPVTTLGSEKIEFPAGTTYKLVNDYPGDNTIILYYTTDGSDPTNKTNPSRKQYMGETLTLNAATTIKAAYYSCCGKCVECKNENYANCWSSVWGPVGEYKYTVPTKETVYVGSGGGGGSVTIDKTRKYTKDIFGNEHPTHIGYIKGYPDGSVQPDGHITREEMTAILYRIKNHDYDEPFVVTGEMFPDVKKSRWSVKEIEYMTNEGVIVGYPDGEFKPARQLTRAEFASLIARFTHIPEYNKKNIFPDLDKNHWAYNDILALYGAGLLQGYEDATVKPENLITRAEVMTVVNKLLGRNPSEEYVKSLKFNPFNDLIDTKWYYVIVLEATITHNYYLDDNGLEIKWEDCK